MLYPPQYLLYPREYASHGPGSAARALGPPAAAPDELPRRPVPAAAAVGA